jgi:hypothetical protein
MPGVHESFPFWNSNSGKSSFILSVSTDQRLQSFRRFRAVMSVLRILLAVSLLRPILLLAQTNEDRALLQQARSRYYSPTSLPGAITCESSVDWDAFAKQPGIDQLEGGGNFEPLKNLQISFETRSASHTEVTVTGDPAFDSQKDKLRHQISAFFRAYWTIAAGRLLPRPNTVFEMTPTTDGYSVTQQLTDGKVDTIQMDRAFVITKATSVAQSGKVDLVPSFEMENDGLLHLRGIKVNFHVGESVSVYQYTFDYQQVDGYFIPEHVTMSIPGALSFVHTFSHCKAVEKRRAPAPAVPESGGPE